MTGPTPLRYRLAQVDAALAAHVRAIRVAPAATYTALEHRRRIDALLDHRLILMAEAALDPPRSDR